MAVACPLDAVLSRAAVLPLAALALGIACPPASAAAYAVLPALVAASVFAAFLLVEARPIARGDLGGLGGDVLRLAVLAPALAWGPAPRSE